ncbi:hypothetical protein AS188_08035 [Kocuria flava]|uniref:DUF304 domain-containing protein n=1 Tax=Kocuria flava TaxID=446860 RepID=A0A0U3GHV6_9MICC|nr:hypothetical protein [Kocuria flava]ALU39710.1 hypothetical protein AS188_08035 [Kocuria flava]GEO91692.1 hypothetical protein KFL01_09980 [Kocuria flava]
MSARPPLGAGERVLVATRPHGVHLLRPFLVLLLVVFALSLAQRALGLVWRPTDEPWQSLHAGAELLLLAAAAWVVLRRVLLPLLRWWRTRYVLTTRHLVLLRGGHEPVRLPLAGLRHVAVDGPRVPALGRRDGRVVADFGPWGGLRLEHAPEARRFADLLRRAADEELARSAGPGPGAAGGASTTVGPDAVPAPHPRPSARPLRLWGGRAAHQQQE